MELRSGDSIERDNAGLLRNETSFNGNDEDSYGDMPSNMPRAADNSAPVPVQSNVVVNSRQIMTHQDGRASLMDEVTVLDTRAAMSVEHVQDGNSAPVATPPAMVVSLPPVPPLPTPASLSLERRPQPRQALISQRELLNQRHRLYGNEFKAIVEMLERSTRCQLAAVDMLSSIAHGDNRTSTSSLPSARAICGSSLASAACSQSTVSLENSSDKYYHSGLATYNGSRESRTSYEISEIPTDTESVDRLPAKTPPASSTSACGYENPILTTRAVRGSPNALQHTTQPSSFQIQHSELSGNIDRESESLLAESTSNPSLTQILVEDVHSSNDNVYDGESECSEFDATSLGYVVVDVEPESQADNHDEATETHITDNNVQANNRACAIMKIIFCACAIGLWKVIKTIGIIISGFVLWWSTMIVFTAFGGGNTLAGILQTILYIMVWFVWQNYKRVNGGKTVKEMMKDWMKKQMETK